MKKSAIVAGTGFEGRASLIRKHCREGLKAVLKREPSNRHDENAVAVLLEVPRLGGLLGTKLIQVGYIKANTAKSLAKKMDEGANVGAFVKSFYAPADRDFPRITLEVFDDEG
jgi:hypothetical protein